MMVALTLLGVILASGPSQCSVPVPQSPGGNYIVPGVLGDVPYGRGLTLDAYAPPGEARPAAVIIHGGQGNKTTHINQLFDVIDHAGYAWFSVDYHSADDVAEALRYIRCPRRFNIIGKFVLIGVDSGAEVILEFLKDGTGEGANIASSTGLIRERSSADLEGLVMFGAKFSSAFLQAAHGGPAPQTLTLPAAAVLMFQGTSDNEFPASQAESLCKRMLHCVFQPVPHGIHELENWHPDQWDWKEDLIAWLRGDQRGLWKNITYARPDGLPLLMDAYLPEGTGPFPAAIIAHGGGWEAGDKVTYVSPVFEPLARAGIAWFSVDYRLTPYVRVAQQLDDIRAAIRYVRGHAERFHVDPNRIALLGESASGHLVSQVASTPCPDCHVRAVVSFYGVYNLTPWSEGAEDWQRSALKRLFGDWTPEMLREYSPIEHVTADLPPTFLIQGTKDELQKGTLEYAARLKQMGARYDLLLLEGAPHGMENWEGHPEWDHYKKKLVDWLLAALGGN